VSTLAFAVVAVVLHRELAAHSLQDVARAARAIPPSALLAAAALAALSYGLLTAYDTLAVRYAGGTVPYPRVALTSFIAYAFGHNLGLAAFTGGAIRYRMYSALGLSTVDIATVVSFCGLTTFIGMALVGGTALLLAAPGTTAIHLGHVWSQAFGLLLLTVVALYLSWASLARRPLALGVWELRPPGATFAFGQAILAVCELSVAAGVLWVLMPAAGKLEFVAFLGVFAIGVAGGAASQVPGGLGVFEAIVLLALPDVPTPQLLATLLAYRAIYYALPLLLAAISLATHELLRQRRGLRQLGQTAAAWVSPVILPVAPQLIGALVFFAGIVLLVSGATPAIDSRLHIVRSFMPLPLLELSHLAGSVIGLGLLILARGLFGRLSASYHLTFWLLLGGIAASLVKGLDIEEAMLLALVLVMLRLARAAFYRPSSLMSQRFAPGWLASVSIIVGLSIWIGLVAYRHVPYSQELWWTFALHGDAPRMLRATLAVLVALAAFVLLSLLRPAQPRAGEADSPDTPAIARAVAASDSSLANAALTGDKRFLLHPAGDAFVMYQVSGRSWIALGDPVGPVARQEELVWAFREMVDQAGGRTAFYQVSRACLPLYLDLGLSLMKVGEEARVPLAGFSLEGSARAALRQAHRRAQRAGLSFDVLPSAAVAPLMPQLRSISDYWLEEKATAEKGFSLGSFSDDYLRRFPVAVARLGDLPVAFANIWPTGTLEELSIDLMRFGPDAPNGAMDFLFIELMQWGRSQGYRWFNLGMAPLSGLERRALAPAWHRLGGFVYRHGEAFYNFEGLHRYKNKFAPVWEPRYLASQGGLQLAPVLYDLSTLVSGGVRELVMK